ncbi:MAG: hypothetical protein LKJ76_04790 [Lachnospiraceae bacterium]|jgi:hypothetical protein|nr:hypothetical protein [Lachnospiraceae bacterium]
MRTVLYGVSIGFFFFGALVADSSINASAACAGAALITEAIANHMGREVVHDTTRDEKWMME